MLLGEGYNERIIIVTPQSTSALTEVDTTFWAEALIHVTATQADTAVACKHADLGASTQVLCVQEDWHDWLMWIASKQSSLRGTYIHLASGLNHGFSVCNWYKAFVVLSRSTGFYIEQWITYLVNSIKALRFLSDLDSLLSSTSTISLWCAKILYSWIVTLTPRGGTYDMQIHMPCRTIRHITQPTLPNVSCRIQLARCPAITMITQAMNQSIAGMPALWHQTSQRSFLLSQPFQCSRSLPVVYS